MERYIMICLDKKKYSDIHCLEKQQHNLGGRVFMSLLSFSLKLSYFKINITIDKDEAKRKAKATNSLKQELLVQQAIERRAQAQSNYYYLNGMM